MLGETFGLDFISRNPSDVLDWSVAHCAARSLATLLCHLLLLQTGTTHENFKKTTTGTKQVYDINEPQDRLSLTARGP